MNEIAKQDNERRKRLQEFYLNHPQVVKDLEDEMKMNLNNADVVLKAQTCVNRDFFAGKCVGISEIIGFKDYFKNWVPISEGSI